MRSIKDLIFNFFLHIEVNTINLPYWRLKKPLQASRFSRVVRRLMEHPSIRKVLGLNLASAMLLVPLFWGGPNFLEEPHLEIGVSDLITDNTFSPVITKPREYVLPVERLRYVGQWFSSKHPGYDLNSYVGDDVIAMTGGRVHAVENGRFGLGRYLVLDHGQGLVSVYGHLKNTNVEISTSVDAGQKIGEVGMTGYTSGPHLHFEIHDNGRAINPKTYLKI